ncbi:flavin reductase family protein [Microbacterium sp. 18062]|uniref:flavin reductase family protein n=1 Tax=Microbacterium sp. 18062 TaxID=2681410 RepID=UPI00135CBE83|nr:flavin reductase family protein [Microbacterium sp. 18062]
MVTESFDPVRLSLTPSTDAELRRRFIAGMGRTTGAVTVITTDGTAGRFGQTVTAMMSVSADPPALVIGLFRGAPVADAVRTNRCFAVNVLGVDHLDIAQAFAGQGGPSSRYRFGEEWTSLRTASPILTTAPAAFDCHAEQFLVAGTHLLIVGRVVEAHATDTTGLTYVSRAYGHHSPLPA